MKKRNEQREMKKRALLALLFIICYLLFMLASCSEPSTEETGKGYFTISLSASENMRAAYPPSDTSDLSFVAKFKDTVSGAEQTYTSDGSGTIQGKIDIGNYIVTMDVSLISDGSPYARGIAYDNPVAIGSGQNQIKAYAYDVNNAEPPVISAKPQGMAYSFGEMAAPLEVSASVNGNGVISYQWYSNTADSVSGAADISGATSQSYIPSTATKGTAWYYVVVTNTGTGKPTTINTVPVSIAVGANPNPDPGTEPQPGPGGTGTVTDPFLVYDVVSLQKVGSRTDSWSLSAHYKQASDIDLSSVLNWTPIGTSSAPFTGSYDGNGKIISHLAINASTEDYQGFFGAISNGAVVKNVGLVNCPVIGNEFVGGVVGGNRNGTVQNCYATGNVSGSLAVGGVVGASNGMVQYCYATGNVSGDRYVGGVVGASNGMVQYCYATGDISGSQIVGGVLGYTNVGGTVQNCVALNPKVSGSTYIGRVLGWLNASDGTPILANNYGRADMKKNGGSTTWTNNTASQEDGANITSANWGTDRWWTTASNWDSAAWDFTNVWEWGSSLPILRNMHGSVTQNPVVK